MNIHNLHHRMLLIRIVLARVLSRVNSKHCRQTSSLVDALDMLSQTRLCFTYCAACCISIASCSHACTHNFIIVDASVIAKGCFEGLALNLDMECVACTFICSLGYCQIKPVVADALVPYLTDMAVAGRGARCTRVYRVYVFGCIVITVQSTFHTIFFFAWH